MMTMLLKSILIFIFVVISISDWRTHKIPDRWNAGILLVAVLLALVDLKCYNKVVTEVANKI